MAIGIKTPSFLLVNNSLGVISLLMERHYGNSVQPYLTRQIDDKMFHVKKSQNGRHENFKTAMIV